MESYMKFPIDVGNFRPLELGLESEIPYESLAVLQENIQIMRDVVITLTAVARAKGLGGHTGGPYDIVPEVLIIDALRDGGASIHRVSHRCRLVSFLRVQEDQLSISDFPQKQILLFL